MIKPEFLGQNKPIKTENQQKKIQELLATVLAFVGIFVFFIKILFF